MNLLRSDYGKKFSQKGNWSILLNTISDVNKRLKFLSDDILKLKDLSPQNIAWEKFGFKTRKLG